jgi:hypothetical protein
MLGANVILIIGPDNPARDAVCKTVAWVDRRIRVQTVETAAQGWEFISGRKPNMIIFFADVPRISEFIRGVRQAAPAAFLVQSGEATQAIDPADGIMPQPPCRLTMLSFIKQMKSKARLRNKHLPAESGNGNGNGNHRAIRASLPRIDAFKKISVKVAIDGPDSQLKFCVSTTQGTPLSVFMNELGKHQITWYCLHRQGREIEADLNALLEDGDFLLLRASEA